MTTSRKHLSALGAALVFVTAFFPRALGFVGSTSIWQQRARAFTEALAQGDWAATLQAPHPGVTTMWLAGLGRWAALRFEPGFDKLPLGRQSAIELVPVALVVSLCIALAYVLLARVYDRQIALVAALLLALDPYHISLSKAVHVDALVSVFCMVSALYLWVYCKTPSWRAIALSGVFAALGLLTKTPALFMAPYFLLVMLVWGVKEFPPPRRQGRKEEKVEEGPETSPPWRSWRLGGSKEFFSIVRRVAVAIGIWALAFAVTYVLVWPSMWVQPQTTLGVTFGGARYYRDTPHENPIFFLGQATSEDPGPLFYPVNMPVKTTAVSLVGFVLCLIVLFRRRSAANAKLASHQKLALWLGLAFIVFFTAQMTLGEKKFARYALPALQFVILLAAVGWTCTLRQVTRARPWLLRLALAILVALQFAVSVPRHPYYGTHYNYLLGGPRVILGREIVPGQEKGEGLEIAAEVLNDLPLPKLLVVGAQSSGAFYPYFQGKTVSMTDDQVDYLLFTRSILLRRVQADRWEDLWEAYRTRTPKLVVEFDGVPYVWVYKVGPLVKDSDVTIPVQARVDESIVLLGYDLQPQQARPGESVQLTLYWESLAEQTGDYTVFTHLIGPAGELRGQKDNPPQGGMYPTHLWDAGERIVDDYTIAVAPDAPPGAYRVAVGMYTLETLERLPVALQDGTSPPERSVLLEGPRVVSP